MSPLRSRATPRAPLRNDAHAYCTGGCNSDSDCPVDMRCGNDYDGKTKCLRRAFCDACVMNDNCTGGNDACVPTSDGSSRYCTKSCASPYDCGGASTPSRSAYHALKASASFALKKTPPIPFTRSITPSKRDRGPTTEIAPAAAIRSFDPIEPAALSRHLPRG